MDKKFLIDDITEMLHSLCVKELLKLKKKYENNSDLLIMPDLIIDKDYYVYNKYKNEYKVSFTMDPSIIDGFQFTNEISTLDLILCTAKQFYRLEGNQLIPLKSISYPYEVIKYKDRYIMYTDKSGKLKLLEYSNRQLIEIPIHMDQRVSGLTIAQNNTIISNNKLYDLDVNKGILTPYQIKGSLFSLGIDKYVFVQDDKDNSYFFDVNTCSKFPINVAQNIYDAYSLTADHIVLNEKIYRYDNGKISYMEDMVHNVNQVVLPNILKEVDSDTGAMHIIYVDVSNIRNGSLLLRLPKVFDVIAITQPKSVLEQYYKLIPDMVNNNIKRLILNMCRSDIKI